MLQTIARYGGVSRTGPLSSFLIHGEEVKTPCYVRAVILKSVGRIVESSAKPLSHR